MTNVEQSSHGDRTIIEDFGFRISDELQHWVLRHLDFSRGLRRSTCLVLCFVASVTAAQERTLTPELVEKQAQATYRAEMNAKAGGELTGMQSYKIRFIRLDHGGAGWDDGMNQTGADINFLRAFAQATGFKKIASKGESHAIALLAKYPEDAFPPFVYLTGNRAMGRVSSGDQKILRDYCLGGGLLIADAGSAEFDRSFRRFIRQVFPDKRLLDIADDDVLYRLPNKFPIGAPAFWHHGGRRALGIKHEGRWVVFYHPGDMNDAWKSPDHSDATPEMRKAAINLGVNLVYYAFNQWNDAVSKKPAGDGS